MSTIKSKCWISVRSAPPFRKCKVNCSPDGALHVGMCMFVKAEVFCFSENVIKNGFHDRSSVIAVKPKHTSALHRVVSRHCNLSLCQHRCLNAIRLTHDLIRNGRTPTTPSYHTPDLCWLTPVTATAKYRRDPANLCIHYQAIAPKSISPASLRRYRSRLRLMPHLPLLLLTLSNILAHTF